MKLKEIDQRKLMRMNQRTPLAFNVMIGMSMRHLRLDEIDSFHFKKRQKFISVPNLENLGIYSSTEFGDEYKRIRPSKSLNTISLLSIRYLDTGENSFNTDDSSLTISERVIKILGISNNYVENILSRNGQKSNGLSYKKFKSSNNPLQLKNIDNTDQSSVCSSDDRSANIEKNLNDGMNINPTSRDKFIENYSEWSEQWTMNNILNKKEVTDDSYSKNIDRTISVKDNYCQWSSDSESCDNLSHYDFGENLSINKNSSKLKLQEVESKPKVISSSHRNEQENVNEKLPKKKNNFIDESVEAIEDDKIIFTTWIRDLIYVEILKKEVGLFEDNNDDIAKRVILKNTGTDSKALTEVQTQTQTDDEKWPSVNSNQINFVTVNTINLSEVNGNEYSKYSSDYINLLMKSSDNKKSFEITREQEDKELKALKAYNEITLWKDKRKKDLERLKKAPIESISLSKNKFEMKNHPGKEIVRKKSGENSGFKKLTKNLNINLLHNKNNKNLQTRRKLDRSRATVNIPNLQSLKIDDFKISKFDNKIDILKNDTNALNSKISAAASPIQKSTGLLYTETDIKTKIANINWSLFSNNDDSLHKKPRSNQKFDYRRTGFDFIDDRDIVTLLQSAFSFDSRENDRGFYLGPASTELYSVTNSDQIPNVFNEIIKAARLTIVRHECPHYSSTREIDFGDDYLSDLQTFGKNDNQQYYESIKVPQVTEIIRDNNDTNDTAPNLKQKEIFLMDYWFQKYKELVLDSNKLNSQKLAELAGLPGFYLFKKLISQINCSLMVSISTVVSMESIESDHAATTSRTFDESSNPEIYGTAESPDNIFDENQIEGQDIDTLISGESEHMNETYQNMRIYDDDCNWSDESNTFLNFTDKRSEVSLGNGSNMSEFTEE
ncbi:uncharacterized protein LOC130671633 isoform X2 [Microplitis mediator]|nr:uncharacterized protein LOC130671633 isoform X2 [Microplitis mediator]